MTSISAIKAISPSLIGLSFLFPFIYGYFHKSAFTAITMGWSIFVLSCLFNDMLSPLIAMQVLDEAGVKEVTQDQPQTTAGLFVGWVGPTVFYCLGTLTRKLKDKFRS